MMPPKVFLTGVTGYIAGECLYNLSRSHPDYEYAALIRTREKAELVQQQYPGLRVVLGGLEDSAILEKEASEADVVLHAADASDHEGAAKAIAAGLLKGHTAERPGFWLHTGGTGILTFTDAKRGCKGEWSEKEYNDWDGVGELTGLPDDAFHRNVDKIVLEAGENHGNVIRTALICPPTIYGTGRGPVSKRGRQVYEMAKLVLSAKYIPIVGEGKARWNNVHVADLADVYRLLIEAAVEKRASDSELWGRSAYYLVENGEHMWADIAEKIGNAAEEQGYAESGTLHKRSLSRQEALQQAGFEAESWGLNSRGKAIRARKVLGWQPSHPSLEEMLPEITNEEAARLRQG